MSKIQSKQKLRNLKQYRDLSDEEFDEIYSEYESSEQVNEDFQERIQIKMDELGEDYDLSDMKANDLHQLKSLVKAMVLLEDLEQEMYGEVEGGTKSHNVSKVEKLNNIASRLRQDISKVSEDLHLTRRIRKKDTEESVISAIDDLRVRAKRFAKTRMLYIFCPECKMLLSTVWLLYHTENNVLHLQCKRCGNSFDQELKGLYEKDNKNLEDITIP